MKLHKNAALSIRQRDEVRRLHIQQRVSVRKLAKRFGVNATTIQRWLHRDSSLDLSTAPIDHATVVTPDYRAAIIDHRETNPSHGPITIAEHLREQFSFAHRGTVQHILKEEGLTKPPPRKPKTHKRIPVGRHRIQLDLQQLPAVGGEKGFEYKLSAIHLATRLKYSEIRRDCTSRSVADFLRRALDRLPPFFSS